MIQVVIISLLYLLGIWFTFVAIFAARGCRADRLNTEDLYAKTVRASHEATTQAGKAAAAARHATSAFLSTRENTNPAEPVVVD